MSFRSVFAAVTLLLAAGAALPVQAQRVYYRRPAPRVVVLRPAPRPVWVAPAPVVVRPLRPVACVAPAPVVVVRPVGPGHRRPVVRYRYY